MLEKESFGHDSFIDSIVHDGLYDPYNNFLMGKCAEKLCLENNYSRQKQDEYAIQSYERSNFAIENGYFDNEICSVEVKSKKNILTINKDEEPLKFNKDKILSLRPAFEKEGTITAANASSLSDGAASVFLASEDYIKNNIKPIAKIVSHASYAAEPVYFTKAPVYAIEKVLKRADININKIDLFEINEAFSCVAMFAIDELGISIDKVNVNGGAVSFLGHPIGASGTRIFVTLLNALIEKNLKYGIASLCIGW